MGAGGGRLARTRHRASGERDVPYLSPQPLDVRKLPRVVGDRNPVPGKCMGCDRQVERTDGRPARSRADPMLPGTDATSTDSSTTARGSSNAPRTAPFWSGRWPCTTILQCRHGDHKNPVLSRVTSTQAVSTSAAISDKAEADVGVQHIPHHGRPSRCSSAAGCRRSAR